MGSGSPQPAARLSEKIASADAGSREDSMRKRVTETELDMSRNLQGMGAGHRLSCLKRAHERLI
jgi:hypothetical protein